MIKLLSIAIVFINEILKGVALTNVSAVKRVALKSNTKK
ncbi:hypothetical protein CGSMWGv1400E_05340 [Gardnerella vaginalis 1400E]|uniref:Uncharacterized protein n=1 Tax=Gardnerella vaginalis 1400E TaxID=698956 RepID=I4LUF0_GARVA|nr:hypothetical protein CGSMWGv1400E_05340 [Gardnerella vaginalis 1400E]